MTLSFGLVRRWTLPTTGNSPYTPSSVLLRSLGSVALRPLPKHISNRYTGIINDVTCQSMTSITKYHIGTNVRRCSGNMHYKSTSSILPIRWYFGNRWHQSTGSTAGLINTNNSRYYSNSRNSNDSSKSNAQSPPPPRLSSLSSNQPFVPMTPKEEEHEKLRMLQLSPAEKDMELRQLNRQIATLEMKRGINTGELYTWSGKYKALARDYGMPLLVWYWATWISTGIVCYTTITLFDVDVMYLLQQIDLRTGYAISEQVNPEYGKIGMALVVNEIIEPIRLPIVIVTVKPVIDQLFPPKY